MTSPFLVFMKHYHKYKMNLEEKILKFLESDEDELVFKELVIYQDDPSELVPHAI